LEQSWCLSSKTVLSYSIDAQTKTEGIIGAELVFRPSLFLVISSAHKRKPMELLELRTDGDVEEINATDVEDQMVRR